jgi:vacuolar-type H+-ATPase subunit H
MRRFKARKPEDDMDVASRVLELAQQTADVAVADAKREAEEILARARQEAEKIIAEARARAEHP